MASRGSCGVVWCGVVWCGVVWCGVVWCCHNCPAELDATTRWWDALWLAALTCHWRAPSPHPRQLVACRVPTATGRGRGAAVRAPARKLLGADCAPRRQVAGFLRPLRGRCSNAAPPRHRQLQRTSFWEASPSSLTALSNTPAKRSFALHPALLSLRSRPPFPSRFSSSLAAAALTAWSVHR